MRRSWQVLKQVAHRIPLYDGVPIGLRGRPVFNGLLTVAAPAHPLWLWPLKWQGAKNPVLGEGQPSLIFVGDMADCFTKLAPHVGHRRSRRGQWLGVGPHRPNFSPSAADAMTEYFVRQRSDRTLRRLAAKILARFLCRKAKGVRSTLGSYAPTRPAGMDRVPFRWRQCWGRCTYRPISEPRPAKSGSSAAESKVLARVGWNRPGHARSAINAWMRAYHSSSIK